MPEARAPVLLEVQRFVLLEEEGSLLLKDHDSVLLFLLGAQECRLLQARGS